MCATDSSGNVVARYLYDPFGNLLAKSGPLADVNKYRFSSKEVHPNSGLYYYGFRFYEPNLQRWLNPDPIGIRGGMNLYGFVGNDPMRFVDPHGLVLGDWLGEKFDEFGKGLYDSMMGEDRGGSYDQNTAGAQWAELLGGINRDDNVLRDAMGQFCKQVGQTGGDVVEAVVFDKAAGAVMKGVGKVLDKLADAARAEKKLADAAKKAKDCPAAKSGETAATKAGRQAHKDWNPGEGFEKEVTLPSGKRADAVNLEQQHVKELKPDNSRAVKRGEKQVEQYRQELQKEHGGDWKGSVETYKRE